MIKRGLPPILTFSDIGIYSLCPVREGRFSRALLRRNRMRRLRARRDVLSRVREAGVSDRANYVALPSVAGRGQDEGGESRWIGGGNARPVPEERSPRPKSPPNSSQACADCVNLSAERRTATRFPIAREANRHPLRLAALHAPHDGGAMMKDQPARCAGANAHA